MSRLPAARPAAEFFVEHVEHEVLVYDRVHHTAHCLTPAAAVVWALCDGRSGSVARAEAALVASGHKERIEDVVAGLARSGLVRAPAPERVDQRRRRLLGKSVVAAGVVLASPIIYSIVSPSVAQAASASACGARTQTCCTQAPACKTGLRCVTGHCQ